MTTAPQIKLKPQEAARQGYIDLEQARRAANRALRWLRRPQNFRAVAPTHIRQKMRLMEIAQ